MSAVDRTAVTGLHHITCIAGDPQENVDFYVGVLGMRLVKRSVNQDVPGTYHLFYADGEARPGTDLTFFPWPDMGPGRHGVGLTNEVALAIPPGTIGWWRDRLAAAGIEVGEREERFGEAVLPVTDPHGLALALTETADEREFAPWAEGPVPADRQILGLHATRMWELALEPTATFLRDALGFAELGVEHGWHRFGVGGGGSGRIVDVRELPQERRGTWGLGSVHHVAWRVPDDAEERAVQAQVRGSGISPTEVIDRFWFRSVYFKEPGGALFEIATDGPGFTVDEPLEALGDRLVLPPWLEPNRARIEAALPPLRVPGA